MSQNDRSGHDQHTPPPQLITSSDAVHRGLIQPPQHEIMPDGEVRLRLMGKDNSGYLRTVRASSLPGVWQSAHYHRYLLEFYAVEQGKICLVWLSERDLIHGRLLKPGDHCIVQPSVPHNIYLFSGALVHTVKYGVREPSDWCHHRKLDDMSRVLIERDLLELYDRAP